ncbi:Asparagine synthetase [glutamine-hydrolyzing] 1 [Stieleria neptunia]|uniref:asparagine synthase (glutamine-hydrolyzing) n=1 Tax=Stieleria neptunia TaxID=2527979 RepID=A0A518I3C8_9BACT|nr:asparagine synthase (glutamine-hydrolyzing) [Stieleria neptunia]QDV47619.1 Asparagine synthetase [glutamine-hydrolyzing] 1 [Stieleria neptunia]
MLNRRRLIQATESMAHRGPDGTAVWLQGGNDATGSFGLGHCRLAVNGGPSACQPIRNRAGTLSIVVNGELYDPDDVLRRRLEDQGHRFATSSDSELALHLYAQHGLQFVQYLRGEFAILIHDAIAECIVAVRDRFGIKPLLYTQAAGEIWFASQARAFAAAGIPLERDMESVWHAMSFQYTLPDRTLHRNVYQIPPGHVAVAQAETVTLRQYWDLDYPRLIDQQSHSRREDPRDTAAAFADRLDEAVKIRLRGDVPLVAHLSGGIDSCSVLESASRQGAVASAFSIGFPGQRDHDETTFAIEMAARTGVAFHGVDGAPDRLIDAIGQAVATSEGWCVNGHLPAKFLLSRAISDAGYKVALTGEGADELLAGYAHLKIDLCRQTAPSAIETIHADNRNSYGSMLPAAGAALPTRAIHDALGFLPTFLAAKASQGWMLRSHVRRDFLAQFDGRDAMEELAAGVINHEQLRDRHVIHQSLYCWIKTALAQNILRTLGDGCEAAHGTEGRLPMLDHLLFEWVKDQPVSSLLRPHSPRSSRSPSAHSGSGFTDKWLLRTAMRDRLPTCIAERPKQPFDAPPLADSLLRCRRIRDYVQSKIDDHPFFDSEKVQTTLSSMQHASRETKTATDPLWWMLLSSTVA